VSVTSLVVAAAKKCNTLLQDIRRHASNYDAGFVITSKVEVNGSNALPLYEFAKRQLPGLAGRAHA